MDLWQLAPNRELGAAAEGRKFTATNPTPATGIAGGASVGSFDETKPLLYAFNQAPIGGPSAYLNMLGLVVTAAGTGGVGYRFSHSLTPADVYTSGGSTITPVNCNPQQSFNQNGVVTAAPASFLKFRFGALVCANQTGILVANLIPRPQIIDIVGDVYEFLYGANTGYLAGNPGSGAAPICYGIPAPQLVIPPQWCLKIVAWRASAANATTYEFHADWIEK